jgi:hypothetical protein
MKVSRLRARWEAWSKRQEESKCLPNLGFGGTLVAVLVTSYFAARIGDTLFVILVYGPRAFFVQGLRVSDSKRCILSNGKFVGPVLGLFEFPCWILLIACAEIAAGLLFSFLGSRPAWWLRIVQFMGGAMLFVFWGWIRWHDGAPLLHTPSRLLP